MSKSPSNNESISLTGVMHKIWHHFGDWDMETKHMTRIEKSIYFDMRTLYLNQGKALTDDLALLQRRLSCHSDEEKQALDFVLLDKFKHCKKSKTYKHQEWDLILKNYRWKHRNVGNAPSNASNESGNAQVTDGNGDSNGMSNAERQAIFKQKRLEMIQELRNMGVEVANNIKMAELKPLYEQHFNDIGNAPSNASNESGNAQVTYGNGEVTADNEKNRANNQEPITKEPITNKDNINKNILSAQAQEIFEYWKTVFKKNGSTQFSEKRKAKVIARLRNGYSIDEIKKAISNVSQNEFNVVNEYTDLELICRDVEHLERYRDLSPRKQAEMNFTGANHETRQSSAVEYREQLQRQYDEYWANQAEQGANRPSIIDVC